MPVVALTNRRTFLGLYAPEVLVLFFGLICWQLFVIFGIPLRHPIQLYQERVLGNFKAYFACLLIVVPFLLRMYHLRLAISVTAEIDPDSEMLHSPRFDWRGGRRPQLLGGLFFVVFVAVVTGITGLQDLFFVASEVAVALLLAVLTCLRRSEVKRPPLPWSFTWNEYKRLYLSPKNLLFDLRLIHAISVMFVVFINFKHLIPWINSRLFDQHFAQVEFQLFGKLMTVWLVQTLGTDAAQTLSDGYQFWYAYLGICTLTMILQRNRVLAEEYSAAFILMWMIGIVAVFLMPSLGPCFFFREHLSGVVPVTKMTELQAGLWKLKQYVSAHPTSPKGVFMISGFPSLHFAATLLGTFFLWRLSKPLAAFSALFMVITFVTTIYFGWHYLMDDIGAILLVALVLIPVRRFYRTQLLFIEPRPEIIKMGSF